MGAEEKPTRRRKAKARTTASEGFPPDLRQFIRDWEKQRALLAKYRKLIGGHETGLNHEEIRRLFEACAKSGRFDVLSGCMHESFKARLSAAETGEEGKPDAVGIANDLAFFVERLNELAAKNPEGLAEKAKRLRAWPVVIRDNKRSVQEARALVRRLEVGTADPWLMAREKFTSEAGKFAFDWLSSWRSMIESKFVARGDDGRVVEDFGMWPAMEPRNARWYANKCAGMRLRFDSKTGRLVRFPVSEWRDLFGHRNNTQDTERITTLQKVFQKIFRRLNRQ